MNTPTDPNQPPPLPWHDLPAEIDRYIDGELPTAELATRSADVEADPALATRIAARRAFLARLTRAGATERANVPGDLEARVRAALARSAAPRLRRTLSFAAAALVLLAVGVVAFLSGGESVEALPPEVLEARSVMESDIAGTGGCPDNARHSPAAFPPVMNGELTILGCAERADAPEQVDARLAGGRADGQLREIVVGLVAVPKDRRHRGPQIGKYVLDDAVVYEVLYGDTAYYLSAKKSEVARRGDCAACHNESRKGQANPHRIELRRFER